MGVLPFDIVYKDKHGKVTSKSAQAQSEIDENGPWYLRDTPTYIHAALMSTAKESWPKVWAVVYAIRAEYGE
jgi:hypothetical protein